jgi:hypothetical protein
MAEQDPIDTILAELRQELGDTLTMINIVVALRRNSAHLLTLVHSMLAELAVHIDRVLPGFPEDEEDNAHE